MRLFHNGCGGRIVSKVPIDIIGTNFVGGPDGSLKVVEIDLRQKRKKKVLDGPDIFSCRRCGKLDVPSEEILAECPNCGDNVPLDSISMILTNESLVCEKCAKRLGAKTVPLNLQITVIE